MSGYHPIGAATPVEIQQQILQEILGQEGAKRRRIPSSGSVQMSAELLFSLTTHLNQETLDWISSDPRCYFQAMACRGIAKRLMELCRNKAFRDKINKKIMIMIETDICETDELIELSTEQVIVARNDVDRRQRDQFCSKLSALWDSIDGTIDMISEFKSERNYSLEYLERDHKEAFDYTVNDFHAIVEIIGDYKDEVGVQATAEFITSIDELKIAEKEFKKYFNKKVIDLDTTKDLNDILVDNVSKLVLVPRVENYNTQPEEVKRRMVVIMQDAAQEVKKATAIIKTKESPVKGITYFLFKVGVGSALCVVGAKIIQGHIKFDIVGGQIIVGAGIQVLYYAIDRAHSTLSLFKPRRHQFWSFICRPKKLTRDELYQKYYPNRVGSNTVTLSELPHRAPTRRSPPPTGPPRRNAGPTSQNPS